MICCNALVSVCTSVIMNRTHMEKKKTESQTSPWAIKLIADLIAYLYKYLPKHAKKKMVIVKYINYGGKCRHFMFSVGENNSLWPGHA